MGFNVLFFGLGLLALYFGAEWLVRGAARLARSLGVRAVVVGLTVVALGTSAPELMVSALASVRDQGDVAVGNVVGSNILNIAVILGVSALIYPLRVEIRLLRRELPFMLAASVFVLVLAFDGALTRTDGSILLVAFVGYVAFVLREARAEPAEIEEQFRHYAAVEHLEPIDRRRMVDLGLVTGGSVALVIGARLLVDAAVFFAQALGVSELVIGLTVVAIGTSLPELATSVMAAFRREPGIALGNAVGSNIFNVLAILGVAAVVNPLPVHRELIQLEMPIMILISAFLLPLALAGTRLRLGRWEGTLLVCGYVVFLWIVIARGATGTLQ